MSIWSCKAVGASVPRRPLDEAEVRRALALLADPAAAVHLQSKPSWRTRIAPGDDVEAMLAAVRELDAGDSIYLGLNPCPVDLRLAPGRDVRAADILRRRWFYLDVDRRKTEADKKLSATEAERDAARAVAQAVHDYLAGEGWPAPALADSGNGFNLLYRVDLPHDQLTRVLLRKATHALAARFDTDGATVDRSTHNADRVAKLPGSWACKGPDTPDRPHRQCRLLHVPAEVLPVPVELFQRLIAPQTPDVSTATPLPWTLRAPVPGHAAYARAALERECGRMACTRPGGLNEQLNKSGFALGQLVGAGLLTEDEVFRALWAVAVAAGCDDPRKDEDTLRRSIEAGRADPREIPGKNGQASTPALPSPPPVDAEGKPTERLTVRASEVVPRKVDWLWDLRVPKGFITIFAGRTGLGKSFVVSDLVARVTTGRETPEGKGLCFEPGNALFLSEDPHEFMLAPRLIEAGADMTRVYFMTWQAMAKYTLGNVEYLERMYQEAGAPDLIVIDPPTNFLGDADGHKDTEVRQVVMHLVGWLTVRNCAVVFILHVNKQSGKGVEALNRVMGTVAWTTTARIAHTFAPDPDNPGEALFVPMKSNIGALPKGLAYKIVSTENLARVDWLGEIETTADEAMAGEKGKPRGVVASAWLIDRFRERLEWESAELFAAAAQEGVSRSSIFEAKTRLALPRARRVVQANGDICYTWWVPANWPPLALPLPPPPPPAQEPPPDAREATGSPFT